MVIAGIVDDHNGLAPLAAAKTLHLAQEVPTGTSVEHAFGSGHEEFAVSQSNGPKQADAFASGRVATHRISRFRSNPQPAPGAMLLKVNLIHGPQINVWSGGQATEFFYARFATADRLGLLGAGVCASENPTAGTVAGTAAPRV
jgi:hypothetical protein